MFTESVIVHRQWHNGHDIIRHNLPIPRLARDEAMVAALWLWDPWLRRQYSEDDRAFNMWMYTPGSGIA